MSILKMRSKLTDLMVMICEVLKKVSNLEVLMPVVEPSVRENVSRLSAYQKVVVSNETSSLSDIYLSHALEEAEKVHEYLRRIQIRFLRSLVLREFLKEEVKKIASEWPTTALELDQGRIEFVTLVNNFASAEELEEEFLALAQQIKTTQAAIIEAKVAEVTKAAPPVKKTAKKRSARSLADQALRESMKGASGSKPQKGTSNPKKAAKRARKSSQVKGKKRTSGRKKVAAVG